MAKLDGIQAATWIARVQVRRTPIRIECVPQPPELLIGQSLVDGHDRFARIQIGRAL
jgi:hypothetical protein